MIYTAIGKLVVKLGVLFVRRRYRTHLRVGLGLGLAALIVGGYLAARRDVPEG